MEVYTVNGDTEYTTQEIFVNMRPYPHVSVGHHGKYAKWVDIGNRDYDEVIITKERYTTTGIKLGESHVIKNVGVLYLKDHNKHIIVKPRDEDVDRVLVLLNVPSGIAVDCGGKLIVKYHQFKRGLKLLATLKKGDDVLVDRAEEQNSLLFTYLGDGKFDFDNSGAASEYKDEELEEAV